MLDKIFPVSGNKISSLLPADDALLFSSQSFNSVDAFYESWNKKMSLATKVKIKYSSIKSIAKEDNEEKIMIKYRSFIGLPSECEFTFTDKKDYDLFYTFIEKEQYFTRTHETLTPFKAVFRYLLGLLLVLGFTIVSYLEAIKIANGVVENSRDAKVQLYNKFLKLIGDKGVLLIGGLITSYICIKIWKRFTNPPNQTRFLPPNR